MVIFHSYVKLPEGNLQVGDMTNRNNCKNGWNDHVSDPKNRFELF